MQVKIFLKLEVSIPYDLHRNWRPGYVHCAESAEQGTTTPSLTHSLTKIWNRKWVWARMGAETIEVRFITSLNRIMIMVLMRFYRALRLCLLSDWLSMVTCVYSPESRDPTPQIFSLWSSTHQAMCTLSIGVFAITKTIIHGVQTYICRNVTYRIETPLTWYAIDDVKLHYTTHASIRVHFEFGAAEVWGRSCRYGTINLFEHRFPFVSWFVSAKFP